MDVCHSSRRQGQKHRFGVPCWSSTPMEKWGSAVITRKRIATLVTALAATVAIAGSLAITSTPASAGKPAATQQSAPAVACYETWIAFSYFGNLKCGTVPISCNWNGDGWQDEVFGIAPDRTIWHVWPNSGGWKVMPNNGRADAMHNCYRNGNGQRQVEVQVAGNGTWYSYYSGGWRGWYKRP